jgi:ribosomal protein L37AE/L43A
MIEISASSFKSQMKTIEGGWSAFCLSDVLRLTLTIRYGIIGIVMRKQRKNTVQETNKIVVTCPICGTSTELEELSAWSFIILRNFYCENCKQTVKGKKS